MQHPSELDTLATAFELAMHDAEAADLHLRDHLSALAAAPTLDAAGFESIPELRTQRMEACLVLGESLLGWLRAGGQVVLEDAKPEAVAPPTIPLEPDPPTLRAPVSATPLETAKPETTATAPHPQPEPSPLSDASQSVVWPPPNTRRLGASDPSHSDERPPLEVQVSSPAARPLRDDDRPAVVPDSVAPDSVAPDLVDPDSEDVDDDPTDEAPASPSLSLDAIDALKARFERGAGFAEGAKVVVQTSLPVAILRRLGAPTQVSDEAAWRRAVDLLAREVRARTGWSEATRTAHQELVSYVAARARYLQDEVQNRYGYDDHGAVLTNVFRTLSAYQAEARKGFANGLARNQRPSSGTWWAESKVWWRRLAARGGTAIRPSRAELLDDVAAALTMPLVTQVVRSALEAAISGGVTSDDPKLIALIEPFAHVLEGTTRLKTLRSVLKQRARSSKAQTAGPRGSEGDSTIVVPDDVVAWTRGKSAVLIGGDRVSVNDSLQQTLDALELTDHRWETGHQVRRVGSVADQVRAGGVDLVVIFRQFISHKVSEQLVPACKSTDGVSMVWVESGYGSGAVIRALQATVEREVGVAK